MKTLKKTTCVAFCVAVILVTEATGINAAATRPPPTIEQHLVMGTTDGPARTPDTRRATAPTGVSSPLELPAWSRLVWASYRDAGPLTLSNWEIYRAVGNGNDQTRVTTNTTEDTQPDYNRGASRVVFASKRDGNYEIYVMNADGSGQTRLTNNNSDDLNPRWSPDSSKIAFCSKRDGNLEIYVMNADGTNQTRLTNNSANDITPAWSPDGSMIMFGSNRRVDGMWALWVMYANGTSQTQFSYPSYFAGYPAWSPDGSMIAYNDDDNNDGWFDLALVRADGHGKYYPGGLSSSYREFYEPNWDPTGQYYAYTAVEWVYIQNLGWNWQNAWIDYLDTSVNQHYNVIIKGVDMYVSWVTADASAPLVQVSSLPLYTSNSSFDVPWTGADVGESGLRSVDVQVRDGVSGAWTLVNSLSPSTHSITYNGADGHTYFFRARGIDNAWNTQPYTSNVNGDASTTVDTSGPLSLYLSSPALTSSRRISATWGAQDGQSGIAGYSISVTLDAGAPISWLLNTASTSGVYTVPAGKAQACFTLSAQNGAGATATLNPVCAQVDDAPPATIMTITLPVVVPWFIVQWQGTDSISGIASYDAQMRIEAGAWTPWLTGTLATRKAFHGALGTTYAFRVRATDGLGNVEPFNGEGISVTTPLLAVAGAVVDNRGRPVAVARVEALSAAPNRTMSGVNGNYVLYLNATGAYTIAVTNDHFGSLPPLKRAQIEGSTTLPEFVLPPANDVISNGHFEDGLLTSWIYGGNALPIITTTAHTGDYAAWLGATVSPSMMRSGTPAPESSWIEQSIVLSGSAPFSPTLSVLYHPLSTQAGNTLYAVISTSSEVLTYSLPVVTADWQHAWIALSDLTSPTATVRLQWEQSDLYTGSGVLVDEVTLGSVSAPMRVLFLPMAFSPK